MTFSLVEIADKIGAKLVYADQQDKECLISSVATLANAEEGQIAFLANAKYRQQLSETNASVVIITEECLEDCNSHALVMKNPYMGYALVAQLLDDTPKAADKIHASAVIDETAQIGNGVTIGANAVIESGVILADDTDIGAGCFIGKDTSIGRATKLWPNVCVYHKVQIGSNCLVQANTTIGSDGFGYANDKGKWIKIPQLGSVIIGDNVEIGANTTVDRGAIDNTEIHDGVILDNQIQIAHNAIIGENTAIAACSVIAGSTEIGKNCTIAGLVGVNGHIKVTDGCVFTGMTMITKSIDKPGVYSSGSPALPNKEWHKMNARIRKLDSIAKRLTDVEKKITD